MITNVSPIIRRVFVAIKSQLIIVILYIIIVAILDSFGLSLIFPLMSEDDIDSSFGNFLMELGLSKSIILLTVLSLFAIKSIVKYAFLRRKILTSRKILFNIRNNLSQGLFDIDSESTYLSDISTTKNTITVEIQRYGLAIDSLFNCVESLLVIVVYFTVLFVINWQITLLFLIVGIFASYANKHRFRKSKKMSLSYSDENTKFFTYLTEIVDNIIYVRSTTDSPYLRRRIREKIDEIEELRKNIAKVTAQLSVLKEPTLVVMISSAIVLSRYLFTISVAEMSLVLLLFYRVSTYITNFQNFYGKLISYAGSILKVEEMLDSIGEVMDIESSDVRINRGLEIIELADIAIQIDGNTIVENVSFKLTSGKFYGIVGDSGSGKSSILRTIVGFLDPFMGSISARFGGIDGYGVADIQKVSGYVPQKPVVYQDSLWNNITSWSDVSPDSYDSYVEVLELVRLNSFIEDYVDIGEIRIQSNGGNLSGGQIQRIALARELYRKPELLILDESTSALDVGTERHILEKLRGLDYLHMVIFVTHRPESMKYCDQLLRIS